MRRSAAPSQLNAAKRPKFTVPYKTLNAGVQSVQVSGPAQSSEQLPKAPAGEDKAAAAVTHVGGNTTGLSPPSSTQVKRTFSPPTFVNRNHANANQVSYSSSQTKCETKYTDNIIAEGSHFHGPKQLGAECADKGKDHDQLLDEQCMQNAEEEQKSVTLSHKGNTEDDCLNNSQRSPLKLCNQTTNGSSKPAKQSLCGDRFKRPSALARCQAARDLPGTVSVETGCGRGIASSAEGGAKCGYFSVVWCKLSKKKHKKWEGDAVLVTQGRHVTLYDMEGKEIGKGSGYKSSELESLGDDETLRVGGKEIQVMCKLSEEQFKSGKCFAGVCLPPSDLQGPSKKPSAGLSKSFTNPVLGRKDEETLTSTVTPSNKPQIVAPRYDPMAPDALVMPQPTAAHQWQHKYHSAVVDVVVDPYLTHHLRPHQRDGITFLYECVTGMRNYGGTGAILADDMGLGKTLQCIALIWTLLKQGMYAGKPPVKKVLIITPGSLVKNWSLEFRKWLGQERLQVFAVTGDSRVEDYVKTSVYPVLIISYEMFVRGYEVIKKVPFDLVVCDEGHRLKNTAIKTTSLISSLATRKRIVLSGTPIQNDLQEFFAVVDFCNPGVLGSSAAFRRVYEDPILTSQQPGATKDVVELGEERAAELSRLTRLFVLRRTQEINNRYLPPKVEVVIFCRPSSLQTSIYREILRSSIVRSCLMGRGFGAGRGAGSPHLLAIAALKQVCNHPMLIAPKVLKASQSMEQGESTHLSEGDTLFSGLVGRYQEQITCEGLDVEHSGKLAALSIILANVFRSSPQDKVVLVSNHTKTLDLLQQFCSDNDYKYVRLDGHTPTAQRQQIVTRFNSPYGQEKIFLLSSKAGGVGLNLVGASRLFLYDIDWNPANDLQAMARVWRDGQKKEVHIYRLLTTGTLEEKVYQRQISKQGLSGAVMDLKASDVQFSQEDLKDLFSFSDGMECETHSLLGCQCDGGVTQENSPHHHHPPVTLRPCQLGASVSDKQARNLSMAELMDWQHLKGSSQHIHRSLNLEKTEQHVSFLFWQKSNADNSKRHDS